MLRQLMEDVKKICRFSFLANYEQYFLPELKSRCQVILFEKPPIKDMVLFASKILKAENIKFESKVLIELVQKCQPDIRKMIWSLQENSVDGELVNTMTYSSEDVYREIHEAMLSKDLNLIRKLLRENWVLYEQLYEYLFDNADKFPSMGGAILKLGDHFRWNRQVLNQEINFIHMVIEMIQEKVIE
jgi:DNA polymerase III delta prime subunit